MGSKSCCDVSSNIRTHATIVGILFTVESIGPLLYALVLHLKKDNDPLIEFSEFKEFFLAIGINAFFVTVLYLIGYHQRVRWCLTVVIAYLVILITLFYIVLLVVIVEYSLYGVSVVLFVLVINIYELRVTRQLRTANSNIIVQQQGSSV